MPTFAESSVPVDKVCVDRLDPGHFSGDRLGRGKLRAKALDLFLRRATHAQRHSRKTPESLAF
ncbi:MAG: hypothetical protein JHD35_25840 [Sphingopyxis sp.]|nr:hypothetical protein [Sphingopyxis sp.]